MGPPSLTARALTARTVHIKLYPTPRSFPERREVLRILERFGEVSMFRSLKYNRKHQNPVHNAFLCLFATEASVNELLNASPLRYSLGAEPTSANETSTLSTPESQTKQFSLNASSTTYDHIAALEGSQNPLHGPFRPIPALYSYVGSALERSIPETLWSSGLVDWETDKGEDVLDGRIDGVRLSTSGSGQEKNVGSFERWSMMKRGESRIPAVMRGLKSLAQQKKPETNIETPTPRKMTKKPLEW